MLSMMDATTRVYNYCNYKTKVIGICVIVLSLIGEGADVRYADSKSRTPLHFVVTAGYNNIGKLRFVTNWMLSILL